MSQGFQCWKAFKILITTTNIGTMTLYQHWKLPHPNQYLVTIKRVIPRLDSQLRSAGMISIIRPGPITFALRTGNCCVLISTLLFQILSIVISIGISRLVLHITLMIYLKLCFYHDWICVTAWISLRQVAPYTSQIIFCHCFRIR